MLSLIIMYQSSLHNKLGKESYFKTNWILIDAKNQNLGRLASIVAKIVRGKHKRNFSPHLNCGDYVIIINSEKINMTGKKWINKKYIHYTGYPGGKRMISVLDQFRKNPNYVFEKAVKGMLPKNKLGRKLFKNIHVFVGSKHNYNIKNPILFSFDQRYKKLKY